MAYVKQMVWLCPHNALPTPGTKCMIVFEPKPSPPEYYPESPTLYQRVVRFESDWEGEPMWVDDYMEINENSRCTIEPHQVTWWLPINDLF